MYIRIESSSNEFYKHLKKLHTLKEREKTSHYLAEGTRAVTDAIKNGADIYAIVLREGYICDVDLGSLKVYELSQKLYDDIKLTVNSQGIMAVLNYSLSSANDIDTDKLNNLLYLDTVTDPGNMGTIIRSADALGAQAIILSKGCVDIFNPKVVRSTMASLHNIPIYIDTDSETFFSKLSDFDIVGTFPRSHTLSCDHNYKSKTLLVMGNEANGISDYIKSKCTSFVTIPMSGNAESLNVATACTVMLYEIMLRKIKNNNQR